MRDSSTPLGMTERNSGRDASPNRPLNRVCCELRLSHLPARNRSDVRDIPAHTGKCFDHRDHHNDKQREVNEGGDEHPNGTEKSANTRKRPEDGVQYAGRNVKQKPGCAEDDGLHCVKTDKRIAFFHEPKNETAD